MTTALQNLIAYRTEQLRRLQRAIDRQRIAVFLLRIREFFPFWQPLVYNLPDRAMHVEQPDGTVKTISVRQVPRLNVIRLRPFKRFSIQTICGRDWIATNHRRAWFWCVNELHLKLN